MDSGLAKRFQKKRKQKTTESPLPACNVAERSVSARDQPRPGRDRGARPMLSGFRTAAPIGGAGPAGSAGLHRRQSSPIAFNRPTMLSSSRLHG